MKLTRRGLFRFGRDIAVVGAIAPVVAKASEKPIKLEYVPPVDVDWGLVVGEYDWPAAQNHGRRVKRRKGRTYLNERGDRWLA